MNRSGMRERRIGLKLDRSGLRSSFGKWLRLAATSGAFVIITSCAYAPHVEEVRIDDAASPAAFATYRWDLEVLREATPQERIDVSYQRVLQMAMDRVLSGLGYVRADDDERAMIVAYQLTINEAVAAYRSNASTTVMDESLQYGLRWRLPRGEQPVRLERLSPDNLVNYFAQGTLHIGAFAPDKSPLWHAMAHEVLNRSHTAAEHYEFLQRTVERTMKRFPRQSRPRAFGN